MHFPMLNLLLARSKYGRARGRTIVRTAFQRKVSGVTIVRNASERALTSELCTRYFRLFMMHGSPLSAAVAVLDSRDSVGAGFERIRASASRLKHRH